jgi:hypothetical protein
METHIACRYSPSQATPAHFDPKEARLSQRFHSAQDSKQRIDINVATHDHTPAVRCDNLDATLV